jgi:uncharacterized protein
MSAVSRQADILAQLRRLSSAVPEIEASAVVTLDGLPLVSLLPDEVEPNRLAAMSASVLSLGERLSLELGRGSFEQVYVRGTHGDVLLMAIGENAVLTVAVRREAKLGMILYYMRRIVKEMSALF